jgi:hypothetical protein
MYSIYPLSLMLIINCLIIYKATYFSRHHQFHQRHQSNFNLAQQKISRRKTQMTRMTQSTTFILIIFILTGAIMEGYFIAKFSAIDMLGPAIINLIDDISFSFPAFNLFILLYSNKIFLAEFKTILFGFRLSLGQTPPRHI